MTLFQNSVKRMEDIPREVRLQRLKEQLAYQQGRVQYTQMNNPSGKKKIQYHFDKIEYIQGKIEEIEAEG